MAQCIFVAAKRTDIATLSTFQLPFKRWQDMAMDIVRHSNDSHDVMDFLHRKNVKLNPKLIHDCHTLRWFMNNNELPCKEKLQSIALQSQSEELVRAVESMYGRYDPAMRVDLAKLDDPKQKNHWPLFANHDDWDEIYIINCLLKRGMDADAEYFIDLKWKYNMCDIRHGCLPSLYVKTHSPLHPETFRNAIRFGNFKLATYILQTGQPQDIQPLSFAHYVYISGKWFLKNRKMKYDKSPVWSAFHFQERCMSLYEAQRGWMVRFLSDRMTQREENGDNTEILDLLWARDPSLILKPDFEVPIHLFPNTYIWLCEHGLLPTNQRAPKEIVYVAPDTMVRVLMACKFEPVEYVNENWASMDTKKMTSYQRNNYLQNQFFVQANAFYVQCQQKMMQWKN